LEAKEAVMTGGLPPGCGRLSAKVVQKAITKGRVMRLRIRTILSSVFISFPFHQRTHKYSLSFIKIANHGANHVFLGRKDCIFDLVDWNPETNSNDFGSQQSLPGRLRQIPASIMGKSSLIKDSLGVAFVLEIRNSG
jgi:hypothetical protein